MTEPYRQTSGNDSASKPAFPLPPRPEGGYGCPRCKSPHTAPAEPDGRFALLSLMNQTTCNSCGFVFNGKTGKTLVPVIVAAIGGPIVLLVVALVVLFVLTR